VRRTPPGPLPGRRGRPRGPTRGLRVSFHGPAEIQVFKERLPAEVRPDLRCDVVVYSAEFAGSFFGANGKALSLADMEEAACQVRCDALLHTRAKPSRSG